MPRITQIGRVMVPVADQDAAIAFYTDKLGFSLDGPDALESVCDESLAVQAKLLFERRGETEVERGRAKYKRRLRD